MGGNRKHSVKVFWIFFNKSSEQNNQIIIYSTADGEMKLEVKLENGTVWLSQRQMVELFKCSSRNIGMHLQNVFNEAELSENSVMKDYFLTAFDGKNYMVKHYNLDAIISVGYRISSLRGTQFRIWATQRKSPRIIRGSWARMRAIFKCNQMSYQVLLDN